MPTTVTLPALGENIETANVVSVLVAVNDAVSVDQPIIEVETEKASVEIPAPISGVINEVLVRPGDQIPVGAPIAIVEAGAGQADADAAGAPSSRDAQKPTAPAPELVPAAASGPREIPPAVHKDPSPRAAAGRLVPAAPSVRRFARQLGVDITAVRGSGAGGRISIDDVKDHARNRLAAVASTPLATAPELPDFSRWGEVSTEPVTTIRRLTAEAVSRAWATSPQVTNHEIADVTRLEALRKRYGDRVAKAGERLTMTAILVKIAATALRAAPKLNASLDLANQRIIFKSYIHIGVAVDTDRGLLVPVIRDADTKKISEIAVELDDLAARARSRKLTPDEMQGGTFTVSNLGGFGGTGFSPIINWPEVAILGVSRARMQPLWIDDAFEPRLMLPLSLSYDHRLVDGADAARFLRWFKDALEEPLLLSL